MSTTNLNFLREGAIARVIKIGNEIEIDQKILKHVANIGLVKGVIVEMMNCNFSGLMLLKINNSTFGISKEIANSIFVKSI